MKELVAFELRLENFSGPLDKLLALIESQKLQINEVSLAQVTGDFISHIEKLGDAPPAFLADFVAVASQLLLLKSKSLLPQLPLSEDEEAAIKDLEGRLLLYRDLKEMFKTVDQFWGTTRSLGARPYFLSHPQLASFWAKEIFYPGNSLTLESIPLSLGKVFEGLEKFVFEKETVSHKIVSLEEKIQEVVSRLKNFTEHRFGELAKDGSRAEVILLFLAILHLAREQLVSLEQGDHFSDIIVKTHGESSL